MDIDVSLILCLHHEGKYLLRTLRSLAESAIFARAAGLKVELVAVLDRADEPTRAILSEFDLGCFDNAVVLEVNNGSLGLSRNDGCASAHGEYFMLCDGDDLVSFNYVLNLLCQAKLSGPMTVVVPRFVMDFGGHYCVTEYSDLDVVTPLAFLDIHPYISRTFFHRQLFDVLKFSDVRLTAGYAYEDWHFNADAVALGYTFKVADDAILFYRIRNESLLRQADKFSVKQIPPSRLFEPEIFLRTCSDSVERLRNRTLPAPKLRGKARLWDPSARLLIAAANRIEPLIELKYLEDGRSWLPLRAPNLAIGQAYFEICRKLTGLRFDHVFLLPNFGVGGAERYFANIIVSLDRLRPDEPILVLLGENHPSNTWLNRLPPEVTCLDLGALSPIGANGIDLITLKLIQSCAPRAILHIRQSAFGQRFFNRFGRALEGNRVFFYYFCEEIRPRGDIGFAQPWSFSFVSENFEYLNGIVSCNHQIARVDQERLGLSTDKWKILPTMHNPPISRSSAIARAGRSGGRVLWASRLSWQKRPDMIRAVASKLLEVRPDLKIDVYGGDPVEFDPGRLAGLPNVRCLGAYEDFSNIAEGDYLCFLYTSLFDGVPTVLLEAAGLGLPIVAPDVGAISEFVVDGESGILIESLLDDFQMASSYVKAIVQLADNPVMRARLAGAAYDRVMMVHSHEPYTKALLAMLEGSDGRRAA